MDSYIIVGIVVVALFVAIMTVAFTKLVLYKKKLAGRYFYQYNGREIVLHIEKNNKIELSLDGELADKKGVVHAYVCKLHAQADGEEITARIDGRLGRMTVDMTAGDDRLPLERREQI